MEKRTSTAKSAVKIKGTRTLTNYDIIIEGINDDHSLRLSDGGFTAVHSEDEVTWIIAEGSNVESIVKIPKKLLSPKVFVNRPAKVNQFKWKGKTIRVDKTKEERYSIIYIDARDGKQYKYDPVIQVNP